MTFSAVRVRNTVTQTLSSGNWRLLNWNNTVFDTGGWRDGVNNSRLIVPNGITKVETVFNIMPTGFQGSGSDYLYRILLTPLATGIAVEIDQGRHYDNGWAMGAPMKSRVVSVQPGDYFTAEFYPVSSSLGVRTDGSSFFSAIGVS